MAEDAGDLARLNNLLNRSSEFIAYFELAESKLLEWKELIDEQQNRIGQQQQQLEDDLAALKTTLADTGILNLRTATESLLNHAQTQVKTMEKASQRFILELENRQQEVTQLSQACLAKIEGQSQKALTQMLSELKHYDVAQFHRIANESCSHVERLAQATIKKSQRALGLFQLRHSVLAILTTALTAFIVSLYLNGELPWEMHQKAVSERQAGKVLLDAWPSLSQEIKAKILGDEHNNAG